MLSRLYAWLLLITAVFLPTCALAQTGPYADLELGIAIPKDVNLNTSIGNTNISSKLGFAAAGAIGYHVLPWLRVEGEIGYVEADLKPISIGPYRENGANVDATTYMANVFADWNNSSKFVPYAGFGIGAATVGSRTPSGALVQSNDSNTVFAWQVGLGSAYKIAEGFSAVLGWRYIQAGDSTLNLGVPSIGYNSTAKVGFSTNEVRTGLRYDF